MGSYGKVTLKGMVGRHMGSGKTIDLPTFIVLLDGRQVAIKEKKFASAIQWTSRLPEDVCNYIRDEVNELLGDSSVSGTLVGNWDHELGEPDVQKEQEALDEFFN